MAVLIVGMNAFAQESAYPLPHSEPMIEEFGELKVEIPTDIDKDLEELQKKHALAREAMAHEEVPGPVGVPVPANAQPATNHDVEGGETGEQVQQTENQAEKAING